MTAIVPPPKMHAECSRFDQPLVRVKLSVNGHDLPLHIDDGFNQIDEAVLGHESQVALRDRDGDDLHGLFIS